MRLQNLCRYLAIQPTCDVRVAAQSHHSVPSLKEAKMVANSTAQISRRRTVCQRLGSITITLPVSGRPTITKRRRNTTRRRSTKRLRTTRTLPTDTTNTQFITPPRPRNCTPSTPTIWQRPLLSKWPRRVRLKRFHFALHIP